jgi:hypothetical protein
MRTLLLLLFISSPLYATENAVNEIVCQMSPYTAKSMFRLSIDQYQRQVYSSISSSENIDDISLTQISERALTSYTSENKGHLDTYTPYALENLITHAALRKNSKAFETNLQTTTRICTDFFKKQNLICGEENHSYVISSENKDVLCNQKSLMTAMSSVCSHVSLINKQKKLFFNTTAKTFVALNRLEYFEAKHKANPEVKSGHAGVAFAGGLMMLMGHGNGNVMAGEVSRASHEIKQDTKKSQQAELVDLCRSGKLIRPQQMVSR